MIDGVEVNLERASYAVVGNTMGEENFLQLSCAGEVLATVSAPSGPLIPSEFLVYRGTGLNDEDEEDARLVVKRFSTRKGMNAAWREAVRFAYLHALGGMMIQDARQDSMEYDQVA